MQLSWSGQLLYDTTRAVSGHLTGVMLEAHDACDLFPPHERSDTHRADAAIQTAGPLSEGGAETELDALFNFNFCAHSPRPDARSLDTARYTCLLLADNLNLRPRRGSIFAVSAM